jgi:hypothetical protein
MDHAIDGGGGAPPEATDWTADEFLSDGTPDAVVAGTLPSTNPHLTAREKLYAFLESRPAGADAAELTGLLFKGAASDPELNARLIHGLIGTDPNFAFDPSTTFWSLRRSLNLRIPLGEARFVVVDLETTGGRPAPGSIIEIGAYRVEGGRLTESFQ